NEEIMRNSVNLIWEATGGQVVTITFNSQLYLATISLDNGTNITINLEAPTRDNQGMDKLINVVSEMFKQQAGDIENANIPTSIVTHSNQHNHEFTNSGNGKIAIKNLILKTQQESLSDSDDDSPGWSECEECYGPKKEFCKICGCSICKWKGDRGHILLCDGDC
ncbi:755_t:CDS:2, partial [Racocetra fulgida]